MLLLVGSFAPPMTILTSRAATEIGITSSKLYGLAHGYTTCVCKYNASASRLHGCWTIFLDYPVFLLCLWGVRSLPPSSASDPPQPARLYSCDATAPLILPKMHASLQRPAFNYKVIQIYTLQLYTEPTNYLYPREIFYYPPPVLTVFPLQSCPLPDYQWLTMLPLSFGLFVSHNRARLRTTLPSDVQPRLASYLWRIFGLLVGVPIPYTCQIVPLTHPKLFRPICESRRACQTFVSDTCNFFLEQYSISRVARCQEGRVNMKLARRAASWRRQ